MSLSGRRKHILRKYWRSEKGGNIAIAFALSLLPVTLAVGGSVDFGRSVVARDELQQASDATALFVSKRLEEGQSTDAVRKKVKDIFDAEFEDGPVASWTTDFSYDAETYTVTVNAQANLKTTFMGLAGIETIAIKTKSTVVNGSDYVEIALVLDNTGSMSSSGKLTQLKSAAKTMIQGLAQTPAGKAGRTSVSIIPFSVPVNVGTGYTSASWVGPVEYNSVCTGSGKNKTCTNVPKTWEGCVGDRPSPYTSSNASATSGSSLYPRYYGTCNIAAMMPLTTNLTAAANHIDLMIASGNTNIPVGLAWGWNMLTVGGPASNARVSTPAERVMRYMILLTDGDNTQNTLGSSTTKIDQITTDTCTAAKAGGITVFTIRVIDGDADLLKKCASSSSYYYNVTDSSMLTSVFQQIMANITRLRISS